MKFAFLTTLAIKMAAVDGVDVTAVLRGAIPELFRAGESVYVATDEHCEGCQPLYCYDDEPDYQCYKKGYPKCCTKTKGNCPTNEDNKPGCECEGDCIFNGSNTCDDSSECDSGMYCRTSFGACGDGVCTYIPFGMCSMDMQPVCGCDGNSYDNECLAYTNGESVARNGRC